MQVYISVAVLDLVVPVLLIVVDGFLREIVHLNLIILSGISKPAPQLQIVFT